MKIYSLIIIALLALSTRTYGQWAGFDVYVTPGQWYEKTLAYSKQANLKNLMVLTQGGITPSPENDTTIAPAVIKRFMERHYPNVESEGIVILDWESNVFKWIRDYPETDPKFKYAEGQWMALINEVRKLRPNVKIGIYGLPPRAYSEGQKEKYNTPGALDNILSKIDIITPSLYIGYPDEQRNRAYNESYLKSMLDNAFIYGKRHNKPVMPFVWHRVIAANKLYKRAILQNDTYADYIEYIKDYSNDGFKAIGVVLWDDGFKEPRLHDVEGINNWLKGKVKDVPTYDDYTLSMMKSIVNKLNNSK